MCVCVCGLSVFSFMLLIAASIYNSICLVLEFVKDVKSLGRDPFELGYRYMNTYLQQQI